MSNGDKSHDTLHRVVRQFIEDRLALVGLLVILIFLVVGAFAPSLAPSDPLQVNVKMKLLPPSYSYPLGTDHLGRCVLSRLIYGARVSLFTSLAVLAATLALSIPLGTISGYIGGRLDNLMMRVVDVVLAFPSLILALAITSMLGPSPGHLMLAFVSVWWAGYARMVRGLVMQTKEKDFVTAAVACGTPYFQILTRHILPNVISPIIVLVTLEIGNIILALSSLSFLGLGAQPPVPEWGVMLNDSRPYIQTYPTLMLFPGLAIMVVVTAFNLVGEGLRDAMVLNSRTPEQEGSDTGNDGWRNSIKRSEPDRAF